MEVPWVQLEESSLTDELLTRVSASMERKRARIDLEATSSSPSLLDPTHGSGLRRGAQAATAAATAVAAITAAKRRAVSKRAPSTANVTSEGLNASFELASSLLRSGREPSALEKEEEEPEIGLPKRAMPVPLQFQEAKKALGYLKNRALLVGGAPLFRPATLGDTFFSDQTDVRMPAFGSEESNHESSLFDKDPWDL